MDPKDLPNGIAMTPFNPEFQADPYPMLKRVRDAAPIRWDDLMQGWFVTTHDDVREVLRDKEMWSDPRKADEASGIRRLILRENEEPSMLFLDDPAHKRLRSLVNKAFTPKAVEAMRPRIAAIANELIDTLRHRCFTEGASTSSEFDLMATFASPLPVIVIAEMLGVDPRARDDFKAWSDAVVSAFFNPLRSEEEAQASERAQAALDTCFRTAIAARRAKPEADLISAMALAENDGDRFTDLEIVSQCNLLLVAGNVTTTDLIGNGVKALMEHPNDLAKLRARPDLLENAVEEMLRYDSPVIASGRIANRSLEISGCPVHARQAVNVSLAAANHDPAVYEHPERFDIERDDTHHQSFGGGRHFCLGAPLARVEAQEGVRALLLRFPTLSSADRLRYRAIPGFRGLAEYWLKVR